MNNIETMKLALEALEYLDVTAENYVDDRIPYAAITALRQAIEQEQKKPCIKGGQCKHGSWCSEVYCQEHCEFVEQAQKQETETCMGCNGNGVVGNILDTDTCPFCKGSGVDQAQKQEPVAYGTWDTMLGKGNRMMMVRLDKGQDGCTVPLYTSPPQRQPLTDDEIWKDDGIMSANSGYGATFETLRELVRAIEAAHGIKENT